MEMLGVGLIIPVLVIMTENNLASKYPVEVPWLNMLSNPSHERLIIGGLVLASTIDKYRIVYSHILNSGVVMNEKMLILDKKGMVKNAKEIC